MESYEFVNDGVQFGSENFYENAKRLFNFMLVIQLIFPGLLMEPEVS